MAVDDTWYLSKKGPDGDRVKSAKHGRGRRYRVRWIDDTGAPKERLFDRKAEADNWDANVRADVSRGLYVDPGAGRTTVAEYGEQWRAIQMHRESTSDRVARSFRLHIDPQIGRLRLSQVRPSHIQAWVKDRSTELAPSTLRVVYSYLVSMFADAALDRVIGVSPVQGVQLPEVDRGDRFVPTPDQVHALAEAVPARYRALVYLAAGCGLRQGEAWGLELEHMNFLRREVAIVQQLVQPVARQAPKLGQPKTKTSRRVVELPTVVGEAVARHIELFPPVPVEILDETDPRRPVTRLAKLLFTNERRNTLRRPNWAVPWMAAVAEVKIPKGFGYHGLRHYYATLLIHAGASVKTVQLALGHSNPTITLNTYAHEWPEAIDRTRSLVDAALGVGVGPRAVSA
jgi:integrase